MNNAMRYAACLAGVLMLGGCMGDNKTSDSDIQVMRVEQVQAALDKGDTVLIDVRTSEAYHKGHIPGAMSVPMPTMRANDSRLANAKRIVVYAGGWTDPLSVAGTKRLLTLGYTNVYEFKGGTEVWTDSGGRLVTADPNATGRAETDR